jgi:PAS domain S-box-containing protein
MATSVSGLDLERFEILERSPGLIGIHTLEGRLLYINPAAATALGYAADEMIGRDFQEFLAEPVRPYFRLAMRQLLQTGSGRGITSVVTRDGRERSWFFRHVVWQQDPEPLVLDGSDGPARPRRRASRGRRAVSLSSGEYPAGVLGPRPASASTPVSEPCVRGRLAEAAPGVHRKAASLPRNRASRGPRQGL